MTSGKSGLAEHQAASADALRRVDNLVEELHSTQLTLATRDSVVDAMQGVIASMRDRIDRAEQEARDRGVAAEAMLAEIKALRCERDAARDVGKALVSALRLDAMLVGPHSDGWLKHALQFFGLRAWHRPSSVVAGTPPSA